MKHENYKKLTFFAALTMLLGSVIGIGIFFKNASILKSTNYNGWGTIVAWVIGGLLSLATAIPYSEMGSFKTKKVHGLPGWAEKACGKKIGYFTRFNYGFFYLITICTCLCFFLTESLINVYIMIFGGVTPNVFVVFAISLGFMIGVGFLNYFSLNTASWIQRITTILKFIPLIMVIILGIALFNTNNLVNPAQHSGFNLFGNSRGKFSLTGALAALPMVLFSFGGFLGVGSLMDKTKDGVKKVPIVIVVGMVLVLTFYLLITISQIIHGVGFVSGRPFGKNQESMGLFGQIFSPKVANIVGILTMGFIAISVYGVVNGVTMSYLEALEQALSVNTFFGSKRIKAKYGKSKAMLIYTAIPIALWQGLILIWLLFLKSDVVIDGLSNLPTITFFAMYAIIIVGYWRKRNTLDTKKINNILFYISAASSVIGVFLILSYQVFYVFIGQGILHPFKNMPFGLFNAPNPMQQWQFLIMFFSVMSLFLLMPLLNKILINKFEKPKTIKTNLTTSKQNN